MRSLAFRAGGVLDALAAPWMAMVPRERPTTDVLREAGLDSGGRYAWGVRRARRKRLLRRIRRRLRRRGPEDLRGAVEVEGLDALRQALAAGQGAMLVGLHGGPREVVLAALRLEGLDALTVRESPPPPWDPPVRCVRIPRLADAVGRARVMIEVVVALRAGALVAVTMDGRGAPAASDGRRGGAAGVARASRAPSFPVVARADPDGRVRIRFGPAVAPPAARDDEPRWIASHEAWIEHARADDDLARLDQALMAARFRQHHAPTRNGSVA